MSQHPIVLAIRFLLEIALLVAIAIWGWEKHAGAWRYILVIALPVVAAVIWGVFRVPNDPKEAPVAVPGPVRLLIECCLFAGAVWALYQSGYAGYGRLLAIVTIVHYAISYDRITWLLKQ